jgi:hypothetical protein
MTYLRYSNVCADFLRNVLKEPFKAKALERSAIFYRSSPYDDGKQGTQSESAICVLVARNLVFPDTLAALLWGQYCSVKLSP